VGSCRLKIILSDILIAVHTVDSTVSRNLSGEMTISGEKLNLKWTDFHQNISESFRDLRETIDFSDVTLVSEDGQQIEAHRVIVSSGSGFLRSLLRRTNHSHPMLVMRGINIKELSAIVHFIYHGETNVNKEDINVFLSIADMLKVKGLTKDENGPKISPKETEMVKQETGHLKDADEESNFNGQSPGRKEVNFSQADIAKLVRGMDAKEMSAIADFIDKGETNGDRDDLDSLISIADMLKANGLTKDKIAPKISEKEAERINQETEHLLKEDDKDDNWYGKSPGRKQLNLCKPDIAKPNLSFSPNVNEKVEDDNGSILEGLDGNYSEICYAIDNMLEEQGVKSIWKCPVCGEDSKTKASLRTHIEGFHFKGLASAPAITSSATRGGKSTTKASGTCINCTNKKKEKACMEKTCRPAFPVVPKLAKKRPTRTLRKRTWTQLRSGRVSYSKFMNTCQQ
jgi:hypothetical protein